MKIQIASDLHLEFLERQYPNELLIRPAIDADVLVLAGDIHHGPHACRMFYSWPNREQTSIVYVAGNHEFYGHVLEPTRQMIREDAELNRIHFLENTSVVIKGVRFLGCTLWTDYKLYMSEKHAREWFMMRASTDLNDHSSIRSGRNPFRTDEALQMHETSRAWLESQLAKPFDGKTVVVTHHGVHHQSVNQKYKDDPLTPAFVSDLSSLMGLVDLWIHGHVHDGVDFIAPGTNCRVVANPAGYILNRPYKRENTAWEFENATFDPCMVVEI